jgi:UDP-2-acetamido-3-amino-2,3-dideoxy-glucuronate N-acetyltransferase
MQNAGGKFKFGVCGAGHWGKNLIRELHKRKKLVCVCELDEKMWKEDLEAVKWTTSFEEMLDYVDVVVIATPIPTHFSLARRALAAGKHIFVEKPLAQTKRDAQRIITDAVEAKSRKVFVGHILHYHVSIKTLFRWLETHPTEIVQHVVSKRGRYDGEVRQTGHLLWDLGPHDLSVVLRIARPNVLLTSVQATSIGLPENPLEIQAKLLFSGDGPSVHLLWTKLSTRKLSSYTVVTTNYIVTFDDTESQLCDKLSVIQRFITPVVSNPIPCMEDFGSPLENELDAFERYLENKEQPYTAWTEGVEVVALLERVQESLSVNTNKSL